MPPQKTRKKPVVSQLPTKTRTDIAPLVLIIVYAIFGIIAVAFAFVTAVQKKSDAVNILQKEVLVHLFIE